MKNIFRLAASVAAVSMVAFSCAKMEQPAPAGSDSEIEKSEGNFTVTFECSMPEEDPESKTEFHDNTIWWSVGDEALFAQNAVVGGVSTFKSTRNAALTSTKSVLSLTVSTFNKPDDGTDAAYFSVFPYASYAAKTTSNGVVYPRITLPSTQSPSTSSFDPKADLLISQYATNLTPGDDGKYSVKLKYKRMVAIAKMTVMNLPSSNEIASIAFSAKKSGKDVEIAGSRFYDLVNGEPSTTLTSSSCTKEYAITLDYSDQNISANGSTGMTAYFMCYPFELVAGDSFKAVVTTTAGEIFTREVTIPSSRTLAFNEGKGSIFSVDMSTATKTCEWLSLNPYSSGSYIPTTDKTYAGLKGSDIASVKWCTADMATFSGITDFDTYIESNGAVLSDAGITNLNSDKTQILSKSGTIDTEYAFLVKATNNAGQSVILTTTARTDWFKLGLATRSSGDLQSQFYGVGLDATKTKYYRIVATSALEGIDPETYYTSTLNPGTSSSLVSTINTKGAAGLFYHESEYYVDKTTKATVISGENYTIMMKVTNTRGETKFCTASANAK